MARFISEAATAAHRTHQAGASCAGSLHAHRLCYLHLGLTVRCRGRLHQCTLRPRQAGAPERALGPRGTRRLPRPNEPPPRRQSHIRSCHQIGVLAPLPPRLQVR